MAKTAKKIRKNRSSGASGPGRLARWWWGLSTEAKRRAARCALVCVGVAVVAGVATLGLGHLRGYVLAQPGYANNRAVLVLVDQPDWMSEGLAREIRDQLLPPRKGASKTFDPELVDRVRQAAGNCPWIGKLQEVRVDRVPAGQGDEFCRAGRVIVRAQWRRPAAVGVWVGPQGNQSACVDAQGVVLPKHWAMPLARKMNLPQIETNATPPPEPGQPWAGPQLATGLAMVKLLQDHPEGKRFASIGVSGDDLTVLMKAMTGRQPRIFCFGHLPLDDTLPVGEVSVGRKLAYIEQWYKNEDRLYLDVPVSVDLRGDKMRRSDARERVYQ